MIFLSASIPIPEREFYGTENVVAIREAIMAFTKVCIENRLPFYFGGHPAITPLVWDVAKLYLHNGENPQIKIYQSLFFGEQIPKVVENFPGLIFTEKMFNKDASVEHMRLRMFHENQTTIAVFIGGMQGVITEAGLLRNIYPQVRLLPIVTTGGASSVVAENWGIRDKRLLDSYDYAGIFKDYLL